MGLLSRRIPGGESLPLRVLLVALSLIYSVTASGIVFGFSGIYSVLVYDVKAFGSLCGADTPLESLPCPAQSNALSLMFTIGCTTTSGCAFFIGLFLDYFGPRITVCCGSLFVGAGLLMVAHAQEYGDLLYYWGFFVIAIGGPCIFNSTYCFGELFPSQSSMIIGALSTGFNSSLIVLTVFSWAIKECHVSFKTMFLGYTCVPISVFLVSLFLFPDEPFNASTSGHIQGPSRLEKGANESEGVKGERGEVREVEVAPRFAGELHRVWTLTLASEAKYPNADVEGYSGEYPDPISEGDEECGEPKISDLKVPLLSRLEKADLAVGEVTANERAPYRRRRSFLFDDGPPRIYNTSFVNQVSSPIFWTLTLVTAFVVLRVNYYIQTLYSQLLYTASLEHPGDAGAAILAADAYAALFNVLLPFVSVLMIPIVGYVMVELGFAPTYLVIAFLHLLFCTFTCLQDFPLKIQAVSFVLYSSLRPFVFGGMAAYIGRIFGFVNFGKLYGLVRLISAMAVSFEYPLQALTVNYFGGNYFHVNLGFLVGGLGIFAFPIYLWRCVFYGYFFRPPTIVVPRL